MFKRLAWLAVLLVMVGCAPVRTPGATLPVPTPAAPRELIPGPPAFQRLSYLPGQTVDQPGFFFLRVATNTVEGFKVPGMAAYRPSADNRWIFAENLESRTDYLLDRSSGAEFSWNAGERSLLSARGDRLLFADQERIWLADAAGVPLAAVGGRPDGPSGVFSADGHWAAVADGQRAWLIDAGTGQSRLLRAIAPDRERNISVQTTRDGAGLLVYSGLLEMAATGFAPVIARRYSWQGDLLGEATLPPVARAALSPDGQQIAWGAPAGGVVATVWLGAASAESPSLRLLGAGFCDPGTFGPEWLADSSGVVLYADGAYRILTPEGGLTALTAGGKGPVPAPDRTDWFAVDYHRVVDGAGRTVAAAVLAPGLSAESDEPWGTAGDELRFAVPAGGGGGRCESLALPARLERAPFSGRLVLAVGAGQLGECVQGHAGPGRDSPATFCLSAGSLVTLVVPPEGQGGVLNGGYWVYVETERGQRGWVEEGEARLGWPER